MNLTDAKNKLVTLENTQNHLARAKTELASMLKQPTYQPKLQMNGYTFDVSKDIAEMIMVKAISAMQKKLTTLAAELNITLDQQ